MRHRLSGRKLNRKYSHLQAMLRNLATSLLACERVTTTEMRAKECRPFVERLITLARRGGLANYRRALGILREQNLHVFSGKELHSTMEHLLTQTQSNSRGIEWLGA